MPWRGRTSVGDLRTKDRNCSGCRYWSEMIAMVQGGEVVALCLSADSVARQSYTGAEDHCGSYAKNSHGAVDEPPNYGEDVRIAYEAEAAMKHKNGRPMFAPDGTMLDDKGNRSIFDDVDD